MENHGNEHPAGLERSMRNPVDATRRSQRKESGFMKTKVTVRFVSGREEQFEMDIWGGTSAENRLMEFSKDPTLVLQTDREIVIIPAASIETITFPLPDAAREGLALPNVRKAKRLK
jgi:hypothetical protein